MHLTDKWFNPYPNQKRCKGAVRSTIIDLQRNRFVLVPNALVAVLEMCASRSVQEVYAAYGANNKAVLDEYFAFLTVHGIGQFGKQNDPLFNHTEEEKEWAYPLALSNAVLELSPANAPFLKKLLVQLNHIECYAIQLQFADRFSRQDAALLVQQVYESGVFLSIALSGAANAWQMYSVADVHSFLDAHPYLNEIMVHQAAIDIQGVHENSNCAYKLTTHSLSHLSCGVVAPFYFNTRREHYAESLHHNTCLNRKIAVDAAGFIKNCPSMAGNFGHINDISLAEVLAMPAFKKHWNITKDQVSVCRDCEFRRVCTDCRAYVETPGDLQSKPLKCGYDPYTCTWEEWRTHPLKQQAISFYGLH